VEDIAKKYVLDIQVSDIEYDQREDSCLFKEFIYPGFNILVYVKTPGGQMMNIVLTRIINLQL